MRVAVLAIALAAAATLPSAQAADRAYPGGNGKIVFVSNRGGGGFGLFTMNPDGSGVHALTAKAPSVKQPAWSPDATKVAYFQDSRIWIVNSDGTGPHAIGPDSGTGWPTWGPGGAQLAFEWNDSIFSMNADGSGVRAIRVDEGAGDDSKWSPSWSANGAKIVYVEGQGEHSGAIYSMLAAGSGAHALTDGDAKGQIDTAPDWSPNGKKIVFQRYVSCNNSGICKNAIYVMNANGTGLHLVAKNAAFPSWSPDGKKIVFVRRAGGNSEIFVMNANGSGQTRITHNYASDFGPDWQPA